MYLRAGPPKKSITVIWFEGSNLYIIVDRLIFDSEYFPLICADSSGNPLIFLN